ncbi:MAG: hypothetical protein Q8Q32_03515 [bacterium]|nr:hypothetical protein [bacterium]
MKTSAIVWIVVVAAVVVGGIILFTGGAGAVTVTLHEQNNSGQSGMATIEDVDGRARVTVKVTAGPNGIAQPAHIHIGSCADIGSVEYPLSNVLEGQSVTTLDVSTNEIMSSLPLALNVHKSAAESDIYVACGDLGGSLVQEDEDDDFSDELSAAFNGSGSFRCEYTDSETGATAVARVKDGKVRTDGTSQGMTAHTLYADNKMYFWTDQFAQGFVYTTEEIQAQANQQGVKMLSRAEIEAELDRQGTRCERATISDSVFALPNITFTSMGELMP